MIFRTMKITSKNNKKLIFNELMKCKKIINFNNHIQIQIMK